MTEYILGGILIFITAFISGALIFRKKDSQNALYLMLNDFKKSIDEYKNQNEINSNEVKNILKDAVNLTKILTTNQNLKGQFGEETLEAIINVCYPNKEIDYIKQFEAVNEEDRKVRPDYLIKLPNNKSLIIDCKLNLEKYIEYKENKDESLNESKKGEFIKDLNNTINNLANKKYENIKDISQLDFILMYIPLEPVLTTIYTDKDFISVIKNANEKNIIIVGNSSILTVLRLVKTLWAQNTQEKNIENIVNCAQNIYDAIAIHSQNLYKIKELLDENTQNFNKEFEKMTNNTKLFKYTEELRNYGIEAASRKNGKKLFENTISDAFLK